MLQQQQQGSSLNNIWRVSVDSVVSIIPTLKRTPNKRGASTILIIIFFIFFGAAYIFSHSINSSIFTSGLKEQIVTSRDDHILNAKKVPDKHEIGFNCSPANLTHTCPNNPVETSNLSNSYNSPSTTMVCPDYFRWIHEDLRPWMKTGITREMVERANLTANFRLVIVNGKAYVEVYNKAFQSRDTFTIWGILQLLRRYPGKLPDLDMMFDCVDWPVVKSSDYAQPNSIAPPPVFRFCGDNSTLDIVFPDWSFWGWPEINIKPWTVLLEELKEGNKRTKWIERDPYAYWKGNPDVAETRQDLLKCNVSDSQDWNARLYRQDWGMETQKGFQQSNLASQCAHRYKIYIEGSAWSVSEKYILACDSLTLLVKPNYHDFFTRSLVPLQHYWPIKENDKCRSIKFAVDWGNKHKQKVQDIGKAASNFIQNDLKMDYVYDYMFHLLKGYAQLLRYKPTIPPNATEFCSETMACPEDGVMKMFMMESLVKFSSDTDPCTMPPPFDPPYFQASLKIKEDAIRAVDMWEKKYWESQTK